MAEPVDKQTTRLVVTESVCEAPISPDAGVDACDRAVEDDVKSAEGSNDAAQSDDGSAHSEPKQKTELHSEPDGSTPVFARVGGVDFSNRTHAQSVIKDLPMDEFLRLVEGASPEELQAMLSAADTPDFGRRPTPNPFGRLFVPLAYKPQEALNIIGWWESRRLFYNVVVGFTGLISLVFLGFLSMHHIFIASLVGGVLIMVWGAFCVGIMANVCYTAGCICDSFARYFWKEKAESFGPILFSLGLIFSLLVVALPIFASLVVLL